MLKTQFNHAIEYVRCSWKCQIIILSGCECVQYVCVYACMCFDPYCSYVIAQMEETSPAESPSDMNYCL